MSDLLDRAADLMLRAGQKSFPVAMKELKSARDAHRGALGALNVAEHLHALDSDEADKLRTGAVQETSEAEDAAEATLAAIPARSQRETLEKVRALLNEGMAKETVEALKADLDRALDKPKDPIVELADRFKRIRRYLDQNPPIGISETIDDPDIEDAYDGQSLILKRMQELTPTTPEGLAALADVVWLYSDYGSDDVGTEGWKESRDSNPDARLLARLRHGAHVLSKR